ncbi:polyprenol reductase [Folsomia candida]|uniref:polyprenol reductase n=1 Tax=Folsomia candida TaxID=158441 RepID=UPI000B90949E|nr:polyprenol reductase [Folsomia candida]
MDSTNFIQIVFIIIGIVTFLPGLILNYADKYIPSFVLRCFRYGRANVSQKDKEYGWLKKIEVPKKWFYHVYIYAICIQSVIVYTVLTTYWNGGSKSWLTYVLEKVGGNARAETVNSTITVLAVIIFFIQLSRRLYETCFVCVYSNTKMNVVHYFLTYVHYTGCMLTIPAYSPVFSSDSPTKSDLTLRRTDISALQYVAMVIFLYGSWVQYQAHVGLASLRKGKENKVVTLKHQIPRGGHFDTISCPNYWGEILVYSAIAILFQLQNYTWNFIALWVIANQITTGVMNHRWYQSTFKDYPKNRKAVIPFIW